MFGLTKAGDRNMQKCDGEGVVPHPPPHHRGKQKATAEVGELQGQEVHWGRATQRENASSVQSSHSWFIVSPAVAHPGIWSWIQWVRS